MEGVIPVKKVMGKLEILIIEKLIMLFLIIVISPILIIQIQKEKYQIKNHQCMTQILNLQDSEEWQIEVLLLDNQLL